MFIVQVCYQKRKSKIHKSQTKVFFTWKARLYALYCRIDESEVQLIWLSTKNTIQTKAV